MRSEHAEKHQVIRLGLIVMVAALLGIGSLGIYLSLDSPSVDAEQDSEGDPVSEPSSREEWVNQSCTQGEIAFNNGDYQEAVANLNRCVPYYTADLHFFIMRGQSWQALGKLDLARIDFEYVLSQDSGHEAAARLLSELPAVEE